MDIFFLDKLLFLYAKVVGKTLQVVMHLSQMFL